MRRTTQLALRALLACVALALAVAPAKAARDRETLTPEAWDRVVLDAGLDPAEVENPLGYTEAMTAFASEIAGVGTERDRLLRLQRHLFDRSKSTFEYDEHVTLTAREAFETRRGNCVAFTNLFVGLARSIGIDAQAVMFHRRASLEVEGDLQIFNTHLAAGYRMGGRALVFDFFNLQTEREFGFSLLDDRSHAGIYFSNRGTGVLRAGDIGGAMVWLDLATRIAPGLGAAWGNLGVVRRRTGDVDGAIEAHLFALELEPYEHRALANMRQTVDDWTDRYLEDRGWTAIDVPTDTAEGLTVEALRTIADGYTQRGCRIARDASSLDPSSGEAWTARAMCLLVRGKNNAARRKLAAAIEVDPDCREALRLAEAVDDLISIERKTR
jgi:tetratricopeptide (TPR) repeat protein